MMFKQIYKTGTAFDDLVMYSDGDYLTRLTFINEDDGVKSCDLPIFDDTRRWLDAYFNGKNPDFKIKYKIDYKSSFQKEVLDILSSIDYGSTVSYGEIAKRIAKNRGIKKMSAQAVGHALGSNPICIIIPCHRVIGGNGNLIGYHDGLNNKVALLRLEKYGKM